MKMFRAPFSFKGRIRRLEYGLSILIGYLSLLSLAFVMGLIANYTGIEYLNSFIILFIIPFYWFLLSQGVKRCHDRGNSGWYILIPFYGLLMLFGESDFGNNAYGPNPKGIGNKDIIDEIGKIEE